MRKFIVLDLFAGAGGLSEGFLQTNKYEFLAHVEWEKDMVRTLRYNLMSRWNYSEQEAKKTVIRFDIQLTQELIHGSWSNETMKKYASTNSEEVTKKGLEGIVNGKSVDIIIGGPPCQAYSIAGRAQDPNSMRYDYRNYLFESFVEIVDFYKPKVFVFENVPGMLSAVPGGKSVVERIYESFCSIGYDIIKPENMKKTIYLTSDFGVPQNRKRVIIFGVKRGIGLKPEDFYVRMDLIKNVDEKLTVRHAIGHLPKFKPLSSSLRINNRNVSHILDPGEKHVKFHDARFHNMRDIKVFSEWLMLNMNKFSTNEKLKYYNKTTGKESNHNKYRNLEWDEPSPTIVSHLYKDGLMFIHPDKTQLRSITVKEAALLQTFPDDYEFVGSSTSCFKMIGNAVPVVFSKKIAEVIIRTLEEK